MSRKKELLDTVASAIDLAKGISEQTIEVRSALVHLTRSLSSVAQIEEDPEPVKDQPVLPEKKSATPSKKSKKK
mgnify:FL=1